MRSSVRVVPWSLMSWLLRTVTGLADVRFGCGMRVPVMTMSCELGAAGAAAGSAAAGAVESGWAVSAGSAGGAVCARTGEAGRLAPTSKVVASRRERNFSMGSTFQIRWAELGLEPRLTKTGIGHRCRHDLVARCGSHSGPLHEAQFQAEASRR